MIDFKKINDKIKGFNFDNVEEKAKENALDKFMPILTNNNIPLTKEDIKSLNIPVQYLLMPNNLVNAINSDKEIIKIEENEKVLFETQLILRLLPILSKIENINKRYDGRPPSKYFRMDTYLSNDEMESLKLTNEDRTYYIQVLFKSKLETEDVPKILSPYIYTHQDIHKLIFKRNIPKALEKEFWSFYVKFYLTTSKNYPTKRMKNTTTDDLDISLKKEIEFLKEKI